MIQKYLFLNVYKTFSVFKRLPKYFVLAHLQASCQSRLQPSVST